MPASHVWLVPLIAVLFTVLIVVGPVVHSIRRLTQAVLRSAEADYTLSVPVQGSNEVAELGRAFDQAAQRVRAQLSKTHQNEVALRDFIANTTHDIMIPLTVLQGNLSQLQSCAEKGELPSTEVLGSAMNETHYLGALIHNLSICAKLDAAELPLKLGEVDLGALVERVVSRHRPIAKGLGVSLDRATPAEPLLVRADVTLLEQTVSNIVYNAIRYNKPEGHVAVIAEAQEGFLLSVIDDGPGLLEEELGRLVERGFRGDQARTRSPEGSGLGLHIAHRVAQLHSFRLSFKRSEYGGLRVELSG